MAHLCTPFSWKSDSLSLTPVFVRRRLAHRPNVVKILDNIGWMFIDKLLRMGVGLFVGVWVARYLGPDQFGSLSFATAFVSLFGAGAGLGLQGIVVRDIVRDPASKEVILGTAAVLKVFGGLLAYALMLTTILWLRPDDFLAKALVAIVGSTLLFQGSQVSLYWFESQVMSKYAVWVQIGSFLVFAAMKVALIINNAPLVAFAWATMAEALSVSLLLLVTFGLRGPRLGQLRVSLPRAKRLLTDSWPLLLSGIVIMIYMKIDQIMLGQMVGNDAVGIYSAAVRISEVWYFIPAIIVASVFPAILEAKERSEKQYYQRMQHLYVLAVWLSVGIAVPMSFLSTPIVTLLFGGSFAASGLVLAIHSWALVFVFFGVVSNRWFVAENRQFLGFQRTLCGAIVNVLLNLFLIPKFGPSGAAAATLVAQFSVGFLFDSFQKETRRIFLMKLSGFSLQRIFMALRRIYE